MFLTVPISTIELSMKLSILRIFIKIIAVNTVITVRKATAINVPKIIIESRIVIKVSIKFINCSYVFNNNSKLVVSKLFIKDY